MATVRPHPHFFAGLVQGKNGYNILQSYLEYIKPIQEFSDQTRKRVKYTTGGSGLMGTGKSSTPNHTIPPCMLMPCLGFIGIWDFLRAKFSGNNMFLCLNPSQGFLSNNPKYA